MAIPRPSRFGAAIALLISSVALALHAQAPPPQGGSQAGTTASAPFNAQEIIPFDTAVRRGTLPNGLQYFIRQNDRPANRVLLRLAVKAGSLHEADDQQGLAHFLEHMAFNGSEHFKPGELISYFESTGARLGPHVNAYTSFDETVYMLELPTDKPDIVTRGFTAFADYAGGLTIDPDQVEKERGVVIEEWRGRLGAGQRIGEQQLPLLYYNSRYAQRLPIGKPEILRTAPASELREFYDTWYRPERMALIVVGSIAPDEVESTIRTTFGPLKARAPAMQPPDSSVPLHQELLVNVASDPEMTQSQVQIVRKRTADKFVTAGDYRRILVESLFTRMLNERFSEIGQRPDARFLGAGGGGGNLSRAVDTFNLSARVEDGKIVDGLTALETEARRLREFGFTAPELDRAKRALMSQYERAYAERDKAESGGYAQEYVNYFLLEEPTPGIEYEYRLVQAAVPGMSLDEVTAMAKARLVDDSRVVLAVSPRKPDLSIPSEADLTTALAAVDKLELTPWAEETLTRGIMETKPAPGAVESRRELTDLGVTVVRFSNGVEAWLKPTNFKNDQITFRLYSPGGLSLAPQGDYPQASLATTYVSFSGLAGLKAVELDRLLAGKRVSVGPFMSMSTHGINGSSSPAELETALQLLHQHIAAPGDDPDAFALMKRQLEAAVANRGQSPGQVFGEKLAAVNTSNHYTAQPLTTEIVAALDRTEMLAFYRERFRNAADFTFFMVGAFTPEVAVPLLAQYVGSLPSTGQRTAEFRDVGIHFPTEVQRVVVEKGREPRSQTGVSFFADPPVDSMEAERINAATLVLQTTLRDMLREELGQTYTVSVGLSQPLPQRGAGHLQVNFGAAPENIQAMTDRVMAEVKRLQAEGPSAALVDNAKESARRGYETALSENGYWLARLYSSHLFKTEPAEILTRNARIDAITVEAVQETFRKYFPLDRYTVVTLMPEPQKP